MKKLALCLILIMALLVPGVVLATEIPDLDISAKLLIVEVVGGKKYTSIQEAIDDIEDNATATEIRLLFDVTDGAGFVVPENSNIIIDFNGNTYNVTSLVGSKGTETIGCQLLKNSTIVFQNGTLTSNTAKMLVQNYSDLTLLDMTLDATASAENTYVLSNNKGNTYITGSTSIKGNNVAFDVCWAPNKGYPEGAQVAIDAYGTIQGDIEIGTWGDIYESDKEDIKSTLIINYINHKGSINVLEDYLKNQITINGGVFSEDVTDYLAEGLFCPEIIEGEFEVHSSAKRKITVIQAEGGLVEVDKTEAQYGEIVKLTITVYDGYKLVSLECGDEGIGGNIIGRDSFIMAFDGDVTITPVFEELPKDEPTPEKPDEEPETDKPTEKPDEEEPDEEEPKQEIIVPENIVNSEVIEEMLLESLKELAKKDPDLAAIIENNDVRIVVDTAEDIQLSADEKEKFEESAQKEVADLKFAKYLDITISVINKENNKHLTNLEELEEEITFSVAIPQEILDDEIEEDCIRKYYIVRDHNGDIDVWEIEAKDGKLEFSSNLFSTYAIAYKDVPTSEGVPEIPEEDEELEEDKNDENKEDEKLEQNDKEDEKDKEEEKGDNPITGDNIVLYVVILLVAVVAIVLVIKKKNNMKK